MTEILTEEITNEDIAPYEDVDDGKQHLTHIVNPPANLHIWQQGMSSREVVEIARMSGLEVVALCGYRWVPKRNPDKYDVCKRCLDIAHMIIAGS